MPKSFAQQIRDVMRKELSGQQEITYEEIACRLDLVSGKEKRPLYRAMRDFFKRGEVERVRPGVVSYKWAKKEIRPANKTRCMYRLIRANKNNTILASDLVANCQVKESTANEYLRTLVKRGVMRRIPAPGKKPHRYQMIDDPGPNLVRNEENAEKLRRIRQKQKEADAAFSAAELAIKKGRAAMVDMAAITDE